MPLLSHVGLVVVLLYAHMSGRSVYTCQSTNPTPCRAGFMTFLYKDTHIWTFRYTKAFIECICCYRVNMQTEICTLTSLQKSTQNHMVLILPPWLWKSVLFFLLEEIPFLNTEMITHTYWLFIRSRLPSRIIIIIFYCLKLNSSPSLQLL